jgi:hypothetical protein
VATRLIDFNREVLIEESISISRVLGPVFSYSDLKEMEFDEYEFVIANAKELHNARP